MRSGERFGRLASLVGSLAGALIALIALASPQPVAAAESGFCQGTTAKAVDAGAAGRAIKGVALTAERSTVHPGETFRARLVNRSDDLASYGQYHRVEQYTGTRWTVDPAGPQGPWLKVLWGLAPDRAGRCFQWLVPAGHPFGTYRFVVPAKVNGMRAGRSLVFHIE